MNLGNKILQIRKDNKMSQEDLAELLNVTRQTISNWENSKNYPDIETLILISDKFNISLDILLKGDLKMVKEIDKKVRTNKKLKIIIILLIFLIILFIAAFAWEKYSYYKAMTTDGGSYTVHKCNYNNERLKLMVGHYAINADSKKWYEPMSYDAENSKPFEYLIVNNTTRERKYDLMNQMNINLNDYANSLELLEYMTDFMENLGAVCD